MVEVRNLSLEMKQKTLLDDLSFTLERGRIYALLGENGSGKTTLIRTLSSFYPEYKGSVMFDGKELRAAGRKERASFHAVLPQYLPQLRMHVSDFLSMYPDASRYLNALGLSELMKEKMNTLSGGERQMVFLSLVLAQDSILYSFDEPEASLDANYRNKMENVIKSLKEEGKTVLVSLHDISKAVEIADSFLVLQHGRLVFSGSCEDFLEKCIYKSLFGLERGDFRDCNGKFHIAFF